MPRYNAYGVNTFWIPMFENIFWKHNCKNMKMLIQKKFHPILPVAIKCFLLYQNLCQPQVKCRLWPWRIFINISSVVEFQRWWVLKSKLFGQESTCHQGKIFKKFLRVMTVRQKVPKSYFQSQFWMSKINRIFSKKKFI